MAVFPTYSKENCSPVEVLRYDNISPKLKTQVFFIWCNYFKRNNVNSSFRDEVIDLAYDTLREEAGVKELFPHRLIHVGKHDQIERYFDGLTDSNEILTTIGVLFHYLGLLEIALRKSNSWQSIKYPLSEAIIDLNTRFKENGYGFEFANDKMIRVDNQILHRATIGETLQLLVGSVYQNANEEFMKALEHYRFKRNHECINECLKSFETTMKIICATNGWAFNDGDTAKPLINTILSGGLLPKYYENYLSGLRQIFKSAVPTIRNKNSGHGQGVVKSVVPDSLATYTLYLTGATICFLVNAQASYQARRNDQL